MNLKWHSEARRELQELDEPIQEEVVGRVEQLRDEPFGEDTSLLSKQGLEIFRLKLKTDRLDHRVFYDVRGDELVILGVIHRDDAYTQESVEKLKART
ncbi:MAG: type II toxin-antitoxin system RelE/ParE family toxin [Candidatus Nanohaloarchaea archaeon]